MAGHRVKQIAICDLSLCMALFSFFFCSASLCQQSSWNRNSSIVCRPPICCLSVAQLSQFLMHGFLSNFGCCFPWAICSAVFGTFVNFFFLFDFFFFLLFLALRDCVGRANAVAWVSIRLAGVTKVVFGKWFCQSKAVPVSCPKPIIPLFRVAITIMAKWLYIRPMVI